MPGLGKFRQPFAIILEDLSVATIATPHSAKTLRHGDIGGLSFGFRARKRDGAVLVDVDLVEVSVVALPANARARVMSVKGVGSKRELKALLHDAGLPKRAVDKLASGGWPALTGAEDDEEQIAIALKASARLWKGK